MTRLVDNTADEILGEAARFLCDGGLVAFPTETVYGLGAHAGQVQPIRRIFEVKGRPATDPLIVHVGFPEMAEQLIDLQKMNQWQRGVLRALTNEFWPGPLTVILPANLKEIAFEVTSGTGWVGLRYPAHPVAQRFLQLCNAPVAAPSANLFGHVSPTSAGHVFSDFPDVDNLWIVDGGRCGFGIESTVLRINDNETVDIFRRGGVGRFELTQCLMRQGLLRSDQQSNISLVERYVSHNSNIVQPAPGQLLVHYAPRIPAKMVTLVEQANSSFAAQESAALQNIVVLDFAGKLRPLKNLVGFYRDLSAAGDPQQAAYSLFEDLRWAESQVSDLGTLWIFDPRSVDDPSQELFLALQDRIFRAASGQKLEVFIKQDFGLACVSVR